MNEPFFDHDDATMTTTFLGMTITDEYAAACHARGHNPWAGHPLLDPPN